MAMYPYITLPDETLITNKDLNYYMGLNYRVEIIEDKEEGGYALHCPELPGCMTCADTLKDALAML